VTLNVLFYIAMNFTMQKMCMFKIKNWINIVYENNDVNADVDFMADRKMGDSETYCYTSCNKT
jgi:hypothetical protein